MRQKSSATATSATLFALLASLAAALPARGAAPAAAKPPAPLVNPEPGWHIIRPGDTLESLALKYLGDTRYWPEIHRLNPGIDDPHWIYPGRRVRVVLERPSAVPNAQVTEIARRVEARPEPVPWRPADQGDLLLEKDGLRTFENSSARLLFDDGTSATVSEESLVFIRRQSPARAATPRKEIEVVLGQADVEAKRSPSLTTPEIEVLVGGTKSVSRAGADGAVRSRARKDGDAAQFMLYEGSGNVAAKGGAVDLAAGTGTVVAPKAAPTPPEPLLAAPALVEPADAGELGRDEPVLRWTPVTGARSYVVELCADDDCGSVREKRAGLDGSEVRLAEPLAAGDSYWRVTAVAPSGLDGFPSAARRFTAIDSAAPPKPTFELLSSGGEPVRPGAVLASPPTARVQAVDRRGHPISWGLLLNERESSPEALATLSVDGHHEVVAVALGSGGLKTRSSPIAFELDVRPPHLGPPTPLRSEGGRSLGSRARKTATQLPTLCDTGLEIWDGTGSWLPVACDEVVGGTTDVALSGREATVRLRATRAVTVSGRSLAPGGSETTVRASDAGSGLALARARIIRPLYRKKSGLPLLEIEVVDRAGNSSGARWNLALP